MASTAVVSTVVTGETVDGYQGGISRGIANSTAINAAE